MSDNKQPALISAETGVTPNTTLKAAMGAFEKHMEAEGFSIHTQKAFMSDLRLLSKYVGISKAVGDIGTKDLNDFLAWLLNGRGVPCSAKSYARRVTTIKVFFGWLQKDEVLAINPSNAVIQRSVSSPLPVVPTQAQLDKALTISKAWYEEGNKGKKDARPHLLLTLLLKTGVKKSEAMNIIPNHVNRDEDPPFLFVRYKNPRLRYKERKLTIDHAWLDVLDAYLTQYEPSDTLFTCTARNLEYILRDVGDAAGLPAGTLSFENLRWASALNDYVTQVDHDHIRQRLGLSKVTWRDTKNKLGKLAEKRK